METGLLGLMGCTAKASSNVSYPLEELKKIMHPHNRTTPLHFPHPPNLGELHWRRRRLWPLPTSATNSTAAGLSPLPHLDDEHRRRPDVEETEVAAWIRSGGGRGGRRNGVDPEWRGPGVAVAAEEARWRRSRRPGRRRRRLDHGGDTGSPLLPRLACSSSSLLDRDRQHLLATAVALLFLPSSGLSPSSPEAGLGSAAGEVQAR
uniref:Uncharacterized protein n=1 Tax=Oryza meridionalis TaxID=40149 RepID=A0A0E0DRZ1_9ORYZ